MSKVVTWAPALREACGEQEESMVALHPKYRLTLESSDFLLVLRVPMSTAIQFLGREVSRWALYLILELDEPLVLG